VSNSNQRGLSGCCHYASRVLVLWSGHACRGRSVATRTLRSSYPEVGSSISLWQS
jgi:hypothetical protein